MSHWSDRDDEPADRGSLTSLNIRKAFPPEPEDDVWSTCDTIGINKWIAAIQEGPSDPPRIYREKDTEDPELAVRYRDEEYEKDYPPADRHFPAFMRSRPNSPSQARRFIPRRVQKRRPRPDAGENGSLHTYETEYPPSDEAEHEKRKLAGWLARNEKRQKRQQPEPAWVRTVPNSGMPGAGWGANNVKAPLYMGTKEAGWGSETGKGKSPSQTASEADSTRPIRPVELPRRTGPMVGFDEPASTSKADEITWPALPPASKPAQPKALDGWGEVTESVPHHGPPIDWSTPAPKPPSDVKAKSRGVWGRGNAWGSSEQTPRLNKWFTKDEGHMNYPEYADRRHAASPAAPVKKPLVTSHPSSEVEAKLKRAMVTDRQDPAHPEYHSSYMPPTPLSQSEMRLKAGGHMSAFYGMNDDEWHARDRWRNAGPCPPHPPSNMTPAFPFGGRAPPPPPSAQKSWNEMAPPVRLDGWGDPAVPQPRLEDIHWPSSHPSPPTIPSAPAGDANEQTYAQREATTDRHSDPRNPSYHRSYVPSTPGPNADMREDAGKPMSKFYGYKDEDYVHHLNLGYGAVRYRSDYDAAWRGEERTEAWPIEGGLKGPVIEVRAERANSWTLSHVPMPPTPPRTVEMGWEAPPPPSVARAEDVGWTQEKGKGKETGWADPSISTMDVASKSKETGWGESFAAEVTVETSLPKETGWGPSIEEVQVPTAAPKETGWGDAHTESATPSSRVETKPTERTDSKVEKEMGWGAPSSSVSTPAVPTQKETGWTDASTIRNEPVQANDDNGSRAPAGPPALTAKETGWGDVAAEPTRSKPQQKATGDGPSEWQQIARRPLVPTHNRLFSAAVQSVAPAMSKSVSTQTTSPVLASTSTQTAAAPGW